MTNIIDKDKQFVWHPFTQAQNAAPTIEITKGEGAYLYDVKGNKYLDLISSWWVTLHGHSHPIIAKAICEQASKLEQVIFTDFTHAPAANLAASLIEKLGKPFSKVFFSDNGSTAVEVALKMAYQYHYNLGQSRKLFLAFNGGYHGDTFGAMSAGIGSSFFHPFEPLCFSVHTLPYPNTHIHDSEVEAKEKHSLAELEAFWKAQQSNSGAYHGAFSARSGWYAHVSR